MNNPKKPAADLTVPEPPPPAPNLPPPAPPPDPSTIPQPPPGFVPPNFTDFRGFHPHKSELATVPDAVLELQGFQDYADVFGKTAPPADQVISGLSVAYKWTQVLDASHAWLVYAKAMDAMTWKSGISLMDDLKGPFKLAVKLDPTLANRYPALLRLLSAHTAASKKGLTTKKKVASGEPVKSKAAQRTAAKKAAKAARAAGQTTPAAQPKPPAPPAEPSPPQPAGAAPARS